MATTTTLPQVNAITSLSTEERASILDLLFEPSVPLHTLSVDLLHTQSFESYNDLIASIGVLLTDLSESSSSSDTQWLDSILGAHSRLGGKKIDSAQSRAEQAQLNTGSDDEAAHLNQLNENYEAKYPGLRYVYVCLNAWISLTPVLELIRACRVFVNGRSRPIIMEDMRTRIARGDIDAERRDAIKVRLTW